MLVGLLSGKLQRYLTRPGHEIEDFLTAVVLGSCQYVPAEDALLPFIGRAVDADGSELRQSLGGITEVEYDFWPRWVKPGADGPTEDDEERDTDAPSHRAAGWNEPEVVLRLRRADQSWAWILVEAKLGSGKSSYASEEGPVTDQLGKYWIDLQRRALEARAHPLAIVYLTTSASRPDADFAETQDELRAKGCSGAPLYWLSWRTFAESVDGDAHRILRDVCTLLRDHWSLARVEPMTSWPTPPRALTSWRFGAGWTWPPRALRYSSVAATVPSGTAPTAAGGAPRVTSAWTFEGDRT